MLGLCKDYVRTTEALFQHCTGDVVGLAVADNVQLAVLDEFVDLRI